MSYSKDYSKSCTAIIVLVIREDQVPYGIPLGLRPRITPGFFLEESFGDQVSTNALAKVNVPKYRKKFMDALQESIKHKNISRFRENIRRNSLKKIKAEQEKKND